MNGLVYHVASGQSFFTGLVLILFSFFAIGHSKSLISRLAFLAFTLGLIGVAISSSAIPYWYYVLTIAVTGLWILSRGAKRWRRWLTLVAAAAWIGAAILEVPYHVLPKIAPISTRTLTVVGDSITAGIGGSDTAKRWPRVLSEDYDLDVQDISHMGDTVALAIQRVEAKQIKADVVIVEIGGNDLLGSSSADEYGANLDKLLTRLQSRNRQILMFELPLPPFYHEYGRWQRTLAKRHNVRLIPKRILMSVLTESGSTLDSIHLTVSGHRRMAARVWGIVGEGYGATTRVDEVLPSSE